MKNRQAKGLWRKIGLAAVLLLIASAAGYFWTPGDNRWPASNAVVWGAESAPVVTFKAITEAPEDLPPETRLSCYNSSSVADGVSSTCPVLERNGITYWVFGYKNNSLYMAVASYDASGSMIAYRTYGKQSSNSPGEGARYLYNITSDTVNGTFTLWGQGDSTITVPWSELTALEAHGSVTTLELTPTSSSYVGDEVTMIARVADLSGSPIGSGTVTFKAGPNVLGSVPLDGSGTAQYETDALVEGAYTIAAEYSGVPGSYGGSSDSVAHTVEILRRVVSFDTNGGSPLDPLTVDDGTAITGPYATARDGFSFEGWFRDAGLGTAASFPLTVTEDLILYAKWKDNTPPTATTTAIASNNAFSAGAAKVGDEIVLVLEASEPVTGVAATIAGHTVVPVQPDSADPSKWRATYTLSEDDSPGAVSFTLSFRDPADNEAVPVTATTDGSQVIFYRDAPEGTVQLSATAPTNMDVEAELQVSSDTIVTNNGGEKGYTFTGNGSFVFEFRDPAGNTGTATAVVSNIDKIKPDPATLEADQEQMTKEDVSVTISYPSDAFSKQYRINSGGWLSYTGSIVLEGNALVQARSFDEAGNESEISGLNVTNIDKEAPVIVLNGSADIEHEAATLYEDAGATATDNADGELTEQLTVTGAVYAHQLGAYSIRYNVSDSAGNAAVEQVRTVSVVDTTRPELTLNGPETMVVPVGLAYIDPGVSANDSYDGDLTGAVTVTGAVYSNSIGSYRLEYRVSDSSGNEALAERQVLVVDQEEPAITQLGPSEAVHEAGTPYHDPGAIALDNYDGDISDRITVTGAVYSDRLGTYTLKYDASDSEGNAASSQYRTVTVNDTVAPSVELLGDSIVTLKQGETYSEAGATAFDSFEGDLSARIVLTGTADTSRAGSYTMVYSVADSSGNTAQVERLVRVLSNDALLRQLETDAARVSPEFDSNVLEYEGRVANAVRKFAFSLRVNEPNATVRINGEEVTLDFDGYAQAEAALSVGRNEIVIEVKAHDGSLRMYMLRIVRDSSSSGGAEATGQAEAPGEVAVFWGGQAQGAATLTVRQENDRTLSVVALEEERLLRRLEEMQDGEVVSISVERPDDAILWELNGRVAKTMEAKEAVLEIRTEEASYRLPARELGIDEIAGQFGADLQLENIRIRVEMSRPSEVGIRKAKEEAEGMGLKLVGAPVQFEVWAEYEGRKIGISDYREYVERSIAAPEEGGAERFTTAVVVEPEGGFRHVPTQVEMRDGRRYAVIRSLSNSVYSLVWNPVAFRDMERHWAREAADDMGARLIVSGDGNGRFLPNRTVTRAEFAAILIRGLGLKPTRGEASFSDVAPGKWYGGDIAAAHSYGLIDGFEDGTFRPDEEMTREQAVAIIARAMKATGLKDRISEEDRQAALQAYDDADELSIWSRSGFADSIAAGVVSGRKGNRLAPLETLTRAEVVVLVRNLLKASDLI